MPEILASQKKMLINRGEDPDKINDEEIASLFETHLSQVLDWINSQPNMRRIDINYNQLLKDPRPQAEQINQFLGMTLDLEEMVKVVNPDLYRQRSRVPSATTTSDRT